MVVEFGAAAVGCGNSGTDTFEGKELSWGRRKGKGKDKGEDIGLGTSTCYQKD